MSRSITFTLCLACLILAGCSGDETANSPDESTQVAAAPDASSTDPSPSKDNFDSEGQDSEMEDEDDVLLSFLDDLLEE